MANILVTGGAGFVGSHLCETLLEDGHRVHCLDNLSSGNRDNLQSIMQNPLFSFEEIDICTLYRSETRLDLIYHLASPASPKDYLAHPLETLKTNSVGTWNIVELAEQHRARLIVASTSEVYGDPLEVPQKEKYWGNVNPVGPRSPYDEGKRFSEAVCAAFTHVYGADARIVRIFNTYGPRLRPEDGRVISNFIWQALRGQPLTVYGDGSQTRSFLYIGDLIRALLLMAEVQERPPGPVNLGNPVETTVGDLAKLVIRLTGSKSRIEYKPLPQDDPKRRLPSIERAQKYLGWSPQVSLEKGLEETITYFRKFSRG